MQTLANNKAQARSYSFPHPSEQPYTARLAGAGSLRRELEAVLAVAPFGASPAVYRDLILRGNVAGKASAAARMWVWKRLKLRYLLDPTVPEFQAFTDAMRAATSPGDRGFLCFLMFARTDRLFREVTLECVTLHLQQEGTVIAPTMVKAAVEQRAIASGLDWSASTLDRAHSHLLAALKDFGVLRGSLTKRTATPRPTPTVALFASRLGRLEGLTDRQIIDAAWLRLLGLDRERAVELLYAAARAGSLGFRMQADVVELDLPPLEDK